jgi:hypothetical protein
MPPLHGVYLDSRLDRIAVFINDPAADHRLWKEGKCQIRDLLTGSKGQVGSGLVWHSGAVGRPQKPGPLGCEQIFAGLDRFKTEAPVGIRLATVSAGPGYLVLAVRAFEVNVRLLDGLTCERVHNPPGNDALFFFRRGLSQG